uniref:Stimulated by retinoic acid 8 n=1 Tax=Malurus cyaneus samueli TaxID=2593467 RepID=A0A8C5TX20_9PASS
EKKIDIVKNPVIYLSPLTYLQEVKHCMAKQHLPQAHHWVPLARLFSSLRGRVLSQSDSCASKYQVLRKAKTSIQKLEQTLCSLLKMKGNCMQVFVWTKSLDLVFMYLCSLSFPSRYLYFYKHTVDLLIEHGIVCTGEVPLPEVSTAISHFWQELSEESRDSILQYCSQRDFLMDPKAACQEPACTEGSVRDSGGNSEEASGSSVSTPEEVMFEDAFDVAAGFLDRSKTQGTSSQSSAFASCTSENPEDHQRLYLQVTDFLKQLFFTNTQLCQVSLPELVLVPSQCTSTVAIGLLVSIA